MHFTKKTNYEKRSDLVKLLKSNKLLRFPGAYNPLCAKVISEIGFDGVYISGGVMSNDLGIPDIGLTTLNQVSYRSEQIAKVTDLPSIVDADTGFKNCEKTISTFEDKGLSGCHIEDQINEKRCGHLDNKELISTKEMVEKMSKMISGQTYRKMFAGRGREMALKQPFVWFHQESFGGSTLRESGFPEIRDSGLANLPEFRKACK